MFAHFNRDQFRPPDNVLAQCECVRIERNGRADRRGKFIRDWAREHCNSLVWWELEGWDDREPVDRPEVWLYYFYDRFKY